MSDRPRPTSAPVARAEALDDSWRLEADCRGMDPALWFPTSNIGVTEEGQRICAGCPVRAECLEYAMVAGEDDGVWGGVSEDDRRKLRKTLRHCALSGCTRTFTRTFTGEAYCCAEHAAEGRRASQRASRERLRDQREAG